MDTVYFFSFLVQGIFVGFVYKNNVGKILFILFFMCGIALLILTPNVWSSTSYFTHEWYENVIAIICFYIGGSVGETTYEELVGAFKS